MDELTTQRAHRADLERLQAEVDRLTAERDEAHRVAAGIIGYIQGVPPDMVARLDAATGGVIPIEAAGETFDVMLDAPLARHDYARLYTIACDHARR